MPTHYPCGCPTTTAGVAHRSDCPALYTPPPAFRWMPVAESRVPFACPVCRGHGTVSRPPHVAGDQDEWSATGTPAYPCRACAGTGIVWSTAGKESP